MNQQGTSRQRIPPTFLTPKEVAARWRLGLSTVYELKDAGKLPHYRLGGTIRFTLADVEAYEADGRVEAPRIPLRLRERRRAG